MDEGPCPYHPRESLRLHESHHEPFDVPVLHPEPGRDRGDCRHLCRGLLVRRCHHPSIRRLVARQRRQACCSCYRPSASGPGTSGLCVRADALSGDSAPHDPRRRPLVLELHDRNGRIRCHLPSALCRGHGILRDGNGLGIGYRTCPRPRAHVWLRLQGALCLCGRHSFSRPHPLHVHQGTQGRCAAQEARPQDHHQQGLASCHGHDACLHVYVRRPLCLGGEPSFWLHLLPRYVCDAPACPCDSGQACG